MQRKQSTTKLNDEVRLRIYSFIPLEEYITKIAILSRNERNICRESELASEGKLLKYSAFQKLDRKCNLHDGKLEREVESMRAVLDLVSSIEI